jgi:hypothetical protein
MLQDLGHRAPIDPEHPCGLATAHAVPQNGQTNATIKLHAVHPRPWIIKTIQRLPGGGVLRRHPSTMPATNVADYCSAILT